jgi:hypothetical protein
MARRSRVVLMVQEAGRRWAHTARQAGRASESCLHMVCDGAEWIGLQARAVFGADATLLTDYTDTIAEKELPWTVWTVLPEKREKGP